MQALEQENAELRKENANNAQAAQQAVMQDASSHSQAFSLQARPLDTTPPDFDTNKYAAMGNFPGSITIPGSNVSIQVGGFTQIDAITDSHAIGSKDSFVVSSIPTGTDTAGQTNFSIRQTRVFVKTNAPTSWGSLVTYVEGDFFGPDGTDFRVRHAYGQIGDTHQFLAGQTWTTFMDASVYPAIFDYQGPNGMVLARNPMLRYTWKIDDQWQWQTALEDPNPDISEATAGSGNGTSVWPDLASNIRWSPDWGHLQLAGIVRELTFDPTVGSRSTQAGLGLNFAGQVNLFRPVAKGQQDNVVFQVAGGKGIANYFNDTSGLGLDAFNNVNNTMDTLDIWGGFVAYQHFWLPGWASVIGASYLHVDDTSDQPADTYKSGEYFVANLMWYPTDRVWLGVEALYGLREDKDGNTGDDARISFSVQYRF